MLNIRASNRRTIMALTDHGSHIPKRTRIDSAS
jgi:hypothetical protein